MPERIQQILNRIVEWWKKFTTKQKALILSVTAIVIIALVILAYVMSRPTTVTLIACDSADQATSVKDLLSGESISYTTSDDGLTYYVNESDYGTASILLGTNNIPSDGYSLDDALNGSFSTTEADKTKKYQLYLESKFATQLETISNVSAAEVTLSIPENDGTMIADEQESYANVILNLSKDMDGDQAAGIAQYIATGLGNDTTDNILILDSDGNVLFSGADGASTAGTASSNQSAKDKAEASVASEVKSVILGTDVYDNVEVGMNLDMNFDKQNITDYNYYVAEGNTQGYLDSRSESTSESTEGSGGTPGTDSNNSDDTTYVTQDGDNSSSSTSDVTEDYLPNETITTTDKAVGSIEYDSSSISVVATTYVIYNEDTLKANGTLDGTTFDEFIAQNSERVKGTVDQDFYTMVANATGIPEANISITAYEVPMFQYSSGSGRTLTDYLQIALAVLIFAMLGFVVFRSLRKDEEEEVEQELSVESLLESTKEENLDDIGFSEKSEARVLIEKFVDEKPDAVAALLRNWLNDDWS